MITIDHQNLVAGAKGQRVGGYVHAFGGVLGEGDFMWLDAEEGSDLGARLFEAIEPDLLGAGGLEAFPKKAFVSLLHRTGERRLKAAVEVDNMLGGRESLANGGNVIMLAHDHSGDLGMAKHLAGRSGGG